MKVLVFRAKCLIDDNEYRTLKNEIESNLSKGYVLLAEGLELVDTVEMPSLTDEKIGSNDYEEENF